VQEILKTGVPAETSSAIVYNGTNPNLFSPNPTRVGQFDSEILIVGDLLRSKGHELVLRALGNLRPSFPRLRCRIIGEGADRARLEALVLELGIGQQVQFVGRQSRLEVADAALLSVCIAQPKRRFGMRVPRSHVLRQAGDWLSRAGD
jgi:glycosyltransferase involved in cell wall biosynthesis